MSRGAICAYSFEAVVPAGQQSVVVSMDSFVLGPVPPAGGWLNRVTVKSEDAALTGINYEIAIWATDSATAIDRAMYEVFRQAGIATTGGAATNTPDLNVTPEVPYRMQTRATVPVFNPDMQIFIDTGAGEAADRTFRVVLEIQGDQTPASPTVPNSTLFSEDNF